MMTPTRDEYEAWEGGVRHKPTGIRVSFAYRNELGDCTFNILKGEPRGYVEHAVEELGAQILMNDMFQLDKLFELRSELLRRRSGNIRREEANGEGRMVDVSDKRIAELEKKIAEIERKNLN